MSDRFPDTDQSSVAILFVSWEFVSHMRKHSPINNPDEYLDKELELFEKAFSKVSEITKKPEKKAQSHQG